MPGFDLTLFKRMSGRWSGQISYSTTWRSWPRALPPRQPDDPNDQVNPWFNDRIWTFKMFASILGPWGIQISPQLLAQNGLAYGRNVIINPRYTSSKSILVDPVGTYHAPNTMFVNLQLRKGIDVGRRKLSVIFEAQNLFNANTATAVRNQTGIQRGAMSADGTQYTYPSFGSAQDLMPPRAFRVGIQFNY